MTTKSARQEAIEIIKISYDWMLEDIIMRTLNPGNHSEQLTQAIESQKLLEAITK